MRAPLVNHVMPVACFDTTKPDCGSPMNDHVASLSRSMSHHKCVPRPDLHQILCTNVFHITSCSNSGPCPKYGPCFKRPSLWYKGAMTMHVSNVRTHIFHRERTHGGKGTLASAWREPGCPSRLAGGGGGRGAVRPRGCG